MTEVQPIRVLCLEDSAADAELAQAILAKAGLDCVVTRVESREAYLSALEVGGFDLIVSGHALPAYDGMSALAAAKEHRPEVPFIFFSGSMDEEVAIESMRNGATDYVLKHRLSRLVPAVLRALKEAESRSMQRHSEERLHQMAFYDGLTNLPNRALLEDRLRTSLARTRRVGRSLAVLVLDLDRFKIVNDSLGHPAGDLLLREVASRLPTCLREGDTTARWGGDEFVMVLADLPEERRAAGTAVAIVIEKIQQSLARPVRFNGEEAPISTSIGVAFYPWDGKNAAELIKNADTAMYKAKLRGHNTYQFFVKRMQKGARAQLFLENDFRRALQHGELTLYYQPQVDETGEKIIGAEALLRWKHPKQGWIPPAQFIRMAEEMGQMQALGSWVLEGVASQIDSWRAMQLKVPRISVNISPHQLEDRGFANAVEALLKTHRLSPEFLELEFTEGAMIRHRTLSTVQAIAQLGVTLAVDDFGTGYSSLSYLKRFPIHTLKIDQSFVRDLDIDPSDAALVRAIIAMAKSLRLRLIAEGVETDRQHTLLREYGCDAYQGFLFGRPVGAGQFAARLSH
ncbi:MAG: putative bifunctional diguanylate cyclase/phosphodiesterase [Gammaproteobacteria bacterium]